MPLRLGLIALSALVATTACSSADVQSDDADDNAGAIHAEEAAKTYKRKELLLKDVAVTTPEASTIGIKAWSVYFVEAFLDSNDATVAYATDADGDVKYAVTMTMGGNVTVIPFDKNGPITGDPNSDVGRAALNKDVFKTLMTDLGGLESQILASRADTIKCQVKVAGLVVKAAATAGVAWAAGTVGLLSGLVVLMEAADAWTLLEYLSLIVHPAAAVTGAMALAITLPVIEIKSSVKETLIACGKY
jgi:hypothetical protein